MRSDNAGGTIEVDSINTAVNSILATSVNSITIISVVSEIKGVANSIVKPGSADSLDALGRIRSTSGCYLRE